MKEELKEIVSNALIEIKEATKEADLLNIKSKYLGKKSKISELMSKLKDMTIDEKKQFGSLFNKIKKSWKKRLILRFQK